MTLWSRLFGRRPPSPLRVELDRLHALVEDTDARLNRIESDFWRNGGVCCPGCGVEGFRDLEAKQERRKKRMAEIDQRMKAHAA